MKDEMRDYSAIYYTDGFCIGSNPTDEGGYTITDETGKLVKSFKYKKRNLTNNEVELQGVYICLKDYCKGGEKIITDSMNTILWIRKPFSKKREDLMWIARDCQDMLKDKNVELEWMSREENRAGWYNENMYI